MKPGQNDELKSFHLDVTRNFMNLKGINENSNSDNQTTYKSILKRQKRQTNTSMRGEDNLTMGRTSPDMNRSNRSTRYDTRGGDYSHDDEMGMTGKYNQQLRDRLRNHDEDCKYCLLYWMFYASLQSILTRFRPHGR